MNHFHACLKTSALEIKLTDQMRTELRKLQPILGIAASSARCDSDDEESHTRKQ